MSAPSRTARGVGGIALGVLLAACAKPPQAAAPAAQAQAAPSPITPQVTLQDLMVNEVDASGDGIWNAVGTIYTDKGAQVRKPGTDAEWAALRRHAVVLLEATNLLVIPNRKIAATAFPSAGPGVFSSDEIQQHVDAHRDEFNAFALGLRAVAQQELAAIDARDADRLLQLGDAMDSACEACHKANWYPREVVPDLPKNVPSIDSYHLENTQPFVEE